MAYTDIDNPEEYFNTKLYTGNGTAIGSGGLAISGIGFAPSWVWLKNRTTGDRSHQVYDVIRGVTKGLKVNSSDAENTSSERLTAFGSDGFTVGNNGDVNTSGNAHVSWNWKAGTAVSGNTTGSGTAKAYSGSVSTAAGFSIVQYLGNGTAAHTIPHHLGAIPRMIIVKKNADAEWQVYHASIGNGNVLHLDTASAVEDVTNRWNDTTPTSSVFAIGTSGNVNGNDARYIAYCFADVQGYSKFGSYIANANANGPFVYTGFKPAFFLTKNTTQATDWIMYDNRRDGFEPQNKEFRANAADAERNAEDNNVQFCANGFKLRNAGTKSNADSSNLFMFMAFAEQPLVTSTGVPATAR